MASGCGGSWATRVLLLSFIVLADKGRPEGRYSQSAAMVGGGGRFVSLALTLTLQNKRPGRVGRCICVRGLLIGSARRGILIGCVWAVHRGRRFALFRGSTGLGRVRHGDGRHGGIIFRLLSGWEPCSWPRWGKQLGEGRRGGTSLVLSFASVANRERLVPRREAVGARSHNVYGVATGQMAEPVE